MGYHARYTRVGEVKERVHQVSTFIMEDGQEEIVWFFTQDITDVIKNRDELRELNYLLDAILNNIPVYMFVKDPEDDFRYLYWNKALANHSKFRHRVHWDVPISRYFRKGRMRRNFIRMTWN